MFQIKIFLTYFIWFSYLKTSFSDVCISMLVYVCVLICDVYVCVQRLITVYMCM